LHTHEHYEELCALAAPGQLAPGERVQLEEHLADCPPCRELLGDFSSTSAQLFLAGAEQRPLTLPEGLSDRFAARLHSEGISISPAALSRGRSRVPWQASAAVVAAAAALLSLMIGIFLGRQPFRLQQSRAASQASAPVSPAASGTAPKIVKADQTEVLQAQLDLLTRRANADRSSAEAARRQGEKLQGELAELQQQHKDLQASNAQQSTRVSELQKQIAVLNEKLTADDAAVLVEENELRRLRRAVEEKDLALQQQQHVMGAGDQVKDLVVARNLHIIDVYDNDGEGKRQRPFGRIFYTEGKSLIFYAYDLADPRKLDRQISFYVWGGKLGAEQSVKRLGIFHNEEEDGRWVLTFDDPRVLAEINSVFVTVETDSKQLNHPRGKKILFAFLGNKPNHP
jgi:putative zinc finger protein